MLSNPLSSLPPYHTTFFCLAQSIQPSRCNQPIGRGCLNLGAPSLCLHGVVCCISPQLKSGSASPVRTRQESVYRAGFVHLLYAFIYRPKGTMQRLVWIWVLVALLQVSECSNREGNHNRFKRLRRDVNFLQDKLIQIKHPQPILDTAKPNELCCNTKQHNFGIAIVNGYDKATGALVNLFEFPKTASNQVGKGITSFLDMIGGRLVGLQK